MPTINEKRRKTRSQESNGIEAITKPNQLRFQLTEDIEKLEPGSPFMSIRDICKNYNVSVYTAKSALSYFVEHGLLEHRQGAGTFRTNPVNHIAANIGIISSHDFDPFTNNYYGEITKL